MKRKMFEIFGALALVCFSFYYTDQAVDIVRRNDPVMKEIVSKMDHYEEKAVDASLNYHSLIPGYQGKKINVLESYRKMRRFGSYEESLLVFEEVDPGVSMDEYYDRYVIRGNDLKHSVALVFKVGKDDDIHGILDVLNERGIRSTFFIDGVFLENNFDLVYQMASDGHEIEVLGYDEMYQESSFKTSLDLLESVTNINGKFCYAEYDQKEVLELCSKEKMHTIIPSIMAKTYPYATVKNKLESGSIIGLPTTLTVERELKTIISYVEQKGYPLERLDQLLSEERIEK